jgi:hypothetical protein
MHISRRVVESAFATTPEPNREGTVALPIGELPNA